jgi:uncharacterized membrane protein YphA (DoxX/SURF4 family)/outer membrane protein assembly factor BamB
VQLGLFLLQILLGLAFLATGLAKLPGTSREDPQRQGRIPSRALKIVGIAEVVGAVAMLVGVVFPPLTFFAAAWLSGIALGTVSSPYTRDDGRRRLSPVALLIPLLVVMYLQPVGLQLLMAPRAAEALRDIAPVKEVVAYPAGAFLESLTFDREGNLYLARTSGIDFVNPAASQARGQIVKISPQGQEAIAAEVPVGNYGLVGVLALDADGSLYVTVSSPAKPEVHGVWRYTPDGKGTQLTALPAEAGPNGIAFGPDGGVYVADSNGGAIWRIDKTTGAAAPWLRHRLLSRRAFLGLFPGANGVKFRQGAFYVAVSDRGHIVRVPVEAGGHPGEPSVYVTGVPTDDFTFDRAGNLYATTHPYNTVVRVSPAGERTIIATAAEGVIGPTDAAFSTRAGEEAVLYVATDGGLFEQRPEQRPNVVAIDTGAIRPPT